MDESVIKHLEQPFALLPKLSEAIRIGSKMSPPAYGIFVRRDGSTCVQGAALLAVGALTNSTNGRLYYANHDMMKYLWPELGEALRYKLVSDFNNQRKTREEIADILEKEGL